MADNSFINAGGGPGNGFAYITFSMPGQRDLGGSFLKWSAAVSDLSPAWTQIGTDVLLRDFRLQFSAEGGYLGAQVGPKWQQLRPSTQRDRMRHGYPPDHPILVRTGELMASVTQRNAPGNIFTVTPLSITVGSNLPKAVWHQWGTRRGLPARTMIGLRWDSRSEILRILGDYIRSQAAQAGIAAYGAGWGANWPAP